MKSIKWFLALLLLCLAAGGSAWAQHHHHGHARFGVTIGPYWGPGYYSPNYYPPSYYYPPTVIERAPPTVYIEQPVIQQAPPEASMAPPPVPETNYWYYCKASKAYYPYVKDCPKGWQKELPQPPGQR